METTRTRLLCSEGLTIAYLLMGASAATAQDDCKLVLDAANKVFDVPSHSYVTMNIGGKPQTAETISVGAAMYVKYNGKWTSGGSTPQEMKALSAKNRQTNKTTCRYMKDEQVDGEAAAVYSVHDVSPKSTSDSTVWISRTKGLMLRSEIDLEAGKTHMSTRIEYGNIKAPM